MARPSMPSCRTRWGAGSTVIPVGARRADRRGRARRGAGARARRWSRSRRSTTRPASSSRSTDIAPSDPRRGVAAARRLRAERRQAPLPDADFIALSAHKLGGPPGVGALLVRDLATLDPVGGQEKGYRRGTQDAPGALAFAAALAARPYDMDAAGGASRAARRRRARGRRRGDRRGQPAARHHRRGRAARRVERVAARPVRPRRHRRLGGQRLLVGQDEGQRACSPRCGSRPRSRRASCASASARRRARPSRRLPRRVAADRRADARRRHDLPRLSGDDAGRARSGGGDAAVDRGEVRQSAQRRRRWGREAAAAIEVARDQVEAAIGLAGGTLRLHQRRDRGAQLGAQGHVRALASGASSSPSPPSMPRCSTRAEWLEGQGVEVVRLPVGRDGLVDLDRPRAAIDDDTALVAAMLVNNEIGVIQPVAELARLAHAQRRADAVRRGPGLRPDGDPRRARPGRHLRPQDPRAQGHRRAVDARRRRAGAAAPRRRAGAGAALGHAVAGAVRRLRRGGAAGGRAARRPMPSMSRSCVELALATLGQGWTINGSAEQRYRGNLNLRRDGLDGARLISDLRNIAFSLGSACAVGSGRPSHVLRALGLERPRGALVDPARLRPLHRRGGAGLGLPPHRRRRARPAGLAGMTRVRFLKPDGTLDREVEAPAGHQSARPRPGRRPAARGQLRGRDGLLDLPRHRRQGGFRAPAAGERGGGRPARPRRARHPHLAAGLPDRARPTTSTR